MIHFKFVGIKDMHNIYYLGLSGEPSLPFGLLVVVSAILDRFRYTYQIQCVSDLLIFQLD